MMIEMEPKMFSLAIKMLKKRKSFDFDLIELKKMKRKYPDLIPNVYLRLWKQDLEPSELHHRNIMVNEAKHKWRKCLKDQGKLDDSESESDKVKNSNHVNKLNHVEISVSQVDGLDTQRLANTSIVEKHARKMKHVVRKRNTKTLRESIMTDDQLMDNSHSIE